MSRVALISALGLAALASACAPTLGPPPGAPGSPARFSPDAFAWSKATGANGIAGRLAYRQGPLRFTCSGATVVLTPETPWSRERMGVLYGSTERAALPTDEVRARTASAPPGDASPFVRRTTCDATDRFGFDGLPDGAWYVITVARPEGQPNAPSVALMRRVTTRGGRTVTVGL